MFLFGTFLFLTIHIVVIFPRIRNFWRFKLGELKYKALFSSIALIGFSLIIFSTKENTEYIKGQNYFFMKYKFIWMYIAITLIIAGFIKNNHFTRWLKHPFLLGILLWSITHILFNQHLNHIKLFSAFLLFSIIMYIGLYLRDKRKKSNHAIIKNTILTILLGVFLTVFLAYFHNHLTGVSIL